ncbi:uncharacterized protein C10orf88 homolog isoform X2 [Sphaeramia orbicularis]|uniref:uncharacterized protein C10orf88 homolog isoform X2 n=1 Tax=Sphaeramia orbicularis TaxID=375764 RepID=UPI00117C6CFD|nr:uncharacterized protein C10orf88 homolog isoform X2 [Sphaeramia orbicularis]
MVEVTSVWTCQTDGRRLSDVLFPVHIRDNEELNEAEGDNAERCGWAWLEQTEEASPCVLTLTCSPSAPPSDPPAAIGRLLLVSEARTMEVYDQTGEYCGTVRGERDNSVHLDSADSGPFYRKQLILDHPSASCEVKLLSLAGRRRVAVHQVVVGLQTLGPGRFHGAGIDMQQVQSLVDEMGASLSPGAQNLMDMVHFQQKNQTGSLSSFLPLLMGGGALSALTQTANGNALQAGPPQSPLSSVTPADEAPPSHNGLMSDSSGSASLDSLQKSTETSDAGGPVSPAQLTEMMSHLLKGQGQMLSSAPDLLPVLQSVCGQVTQLRLDSEKQLRNGSWDLDRVMERRLEQMEQRLKDHVDRRLDALEQKLDKVLLLVLDRGGGGRATGGGGAEEIHASGPPLKTA